MERVFSRRLRHKIRSSARRLRNRRYKKRCGKFTAYKADPVSRNLEERRRMFDFYEQLAISDSRKSGRVEDARRMKTKGYAVADIAEITELPIEEIERL